jgi:hypothetical protein
MAFRFRSLAASATVLVLAFVVSPAPSTFAHTGNAELPVTLTIIDVCTMDTSAQRPRVACAAGGQYRVLAGEYFARVGTAVTKRLDRVGDIVEIAF